MSNVPNLGRKKYMDQFQLINPPAQNFSFKKQKID